MRDFVTNHYTQAAGALGLGLALLAAYGCKGQIGAPEAAPWHVETSESKRVRDADPDPRSVFSGVRLRNRADRDGGMPDATTAALLQPPRYECVRPESRGTGQLAVRRLTRDEYLRSAQVTLGADVVSAPEVQQAAAQIPAETVGDITREFQNVHAYDHVAGVLMTAQALAKTALANEHSRTRLFGDCAQEADRDCAHSFLAGNARRILKRPLDSERRAAMLDAFSEAGEGLEGLQLLLARLLQAPETTFHLALPRQQCSTVERSDDTQATGGDETSITVCQDEAAHDGVVPVDDWTVAARVSYALAGHGPDDRLLDAAERGELRTIEKVMPYAKSLLGSPAARKQLEAMLDAWLNLRLLPTPHQAIADNAGIDPLDLSNEARRELLDFALYEILDHNADAQTLMTAAVGFPRTERMTKLYGVAHPSNGDEPVALTEGHRGLLLRIAPLLSGQLRTSPIMRGVYVRRRLLCDQLASPDFSVVQTRTQALHELDPTQLTSRQITEQITAPTECMACHTQINALGFTLEQFDALGVRRDAEIHFDADGNEGASHPIDSKVVDANIEVGAEANLENAEDLVQAIATSSKYRACIAERLYSQMQLRPLVAADSCALSEVEAAIRSGKSIKEAWLMAALNADTFVRKAPETAP